jgi:hypothetical protein
MKPPAVVVDADDPVVFVAPLENADDAAEKTQDARTVKRPAAPPQAEKASPVVQAIRNQEDLSLKEYLDSLGSQGSYKVNITRELPRSIRVNGKEISTEGHLDTVDCNADEEYIKREFGGGKYKLRIMKKNGKGSFLFEAHRTVTIAGDPNTDRLPNAQAAAAPSLAQDNGGPTILKEVLGVMNTQLERAQAAQQPRGIDPAVQQMIEQMNRQSDQREKQMAALQARIDAMSNQKPEVDPLKDKMLNSLMDGNAGHVEALRIRQESEIRQLKESAHQDLARVQDRHDRDVSAMRASHELALASVKASYDREIAAMRHLQQVTEQATGASQGIQVTTLTRDIARLERDNTELRQEVRELREKKDKPLLEQMKDMNAIKEALGVDEGGEKSGLDKLADLLTNPEAVATVAGIFQKKEAAPAPVQAIALKPRIVQSRTTRDRFVQQPDGQLIPVKKIPKVVTQEDGSQLVLPDIPPEQVAIVIQYLERAFSAGQEPVIVAQSGKAILPADILSWIQGNDNDHTNGVDLFLSKVAKLPSTSPLASVLGRNWVRKVGKALVGGTPTTE